MDKQKMLDWAEILDAYRVVPRIFMACYGYLLYDLHVWYTDLPDPSGSQATLVSVVWGAAAIMTGWYFNSGRKWS